MNHKHYMHEAIELAKKGLGAVAPNPMVGCVIVYNDAIVASGYHQNYGEAHAEVNAINNLSSDINPADCTLYVTLEPCSHFGKTPPCADLIIEKGFKQVMVCNLDVNPLVAGKGVEKLKNAGLVVTTGVLEQEGKLLNKRFFTFYEKNRPYYILKWAQTADGFISNIPLPADRGSNVITGIESQKIVHQMRMEEMGILVGKNTVLADNPNLTNRLVEGKSPRRIIIDKDLEVPENFNVYDNNAKTIVFNAIKDEVKDNITFIKLNFDLNVLEQISDKLVDLKIQSVLVEGGRRVLNDFIQQNLFDEIFVFENPNLKFGNGLKAPQINLVGHFDLIGTDKLYRFSG
ncbi:MAG: bifunctional diaminohydroxyphosphoribosylaminopyrimidine deaminase/5-amino-6-(5-phosphoribosylamino)uracil reductase RibD [Bacteroidota bacterium]|nr:bifunctional diaminohydroxyphosphoribosylaminopyrimidine deaminase/5-amino-6-(5-phosphoribosylamino)uracil reductase RibD [Bacteroidota bacterium]MDP3143858.1 bifunctional diaminohydroxyphosphoribosylaminopyrimidine deaminase/5-amino-6-(5-phosphoribosylamino)uracil reductase RibD [Bacteroidota bacterium]